MPTRTRRKRRKRVPQRIPAARPILADLESPLLGEGFEVEGVDCEGGLEVGVEVGDDSAVEPWEGLFDAEVFGADEVSGTEVPAPVLVDIVNMVRVLTTISVPAGASGAEVSGAEVSGTEVPDAVPDPVLVDRVDMVLVLTTISVPVGTPGCFGTEDSNAGSSP
jgi:hypothetical protein